MIEEWKDIPTVEGYYQCSNLGRVRSIDATLPWKSKTGTSHFRLRKGRILSPGKFRYLQVQLSVNAISSMHYVHRLIALTWIPNPDKLAEVDHINGDRYDNHIQNLRWVSPSDNMIAAYDNSQKKHGEASCKAKLTEKEVFEIIELYATNDVSQAALGKTYGVSQTQIGNIVRGDRWKRVTKIIGGGKS